MNPPPEHIRSYDVSLIIPVLNEKENLAVLQNDIRRVMDATGWSYEVLFADDGSIDGSGELIADIAQHDPHVKLVELSRNFGQTAAMAAGFHYANGRIYVVLDADNQNDPADIPMLIKKLGEGYDVVSGWRRERHDTWLTRRLPSQAANWLISKLTGVRLHDYGCSLKAYRAEYVDSIHLYGEMHRFIPAYVGMLGGRVAELPVNHRPRTRGRSKYGLIRIFKVLMDLMTVKFLSSYATKPSYLFGSVGMLLCLGGVGSAVEVLMEKVWAGTYAHKNPFLLLAVFLFFLGVQFILMGLIAELLIRTYHESQGKPVFVVRRTINVHSFTRSLVHS